MSAYNDFTGVFLQKTVKQDTKNYDKEAFTSHDTFHYASFKFHNRGATTLSIMALSKPQSVW
jgi:hypothetical protein